MENIIIKDNLYIDFKKRFLKAQSEIKKIEKSTINPFYTKGNNTVKYAPLPEVLSAILPVLQNNNLLHRVDIKGTINMIHVIIEDVESDNVFISELPILNTTDMQKMGGCITYGHRYGLLPMMGLSAGIDDDGNDAANVNSTVKKQSVKIDIAKIKTTFTIDEQNIVNDIIKLKYNNLDIFDEARIARIDAIINDFNNDVNKLNKFREQILKVINEKKNESN